MHGVVAYSLAHSPIFRPPPTGLELTTRTLGLPNLQGKVGGEEKESPHQAHRRLRCVFQLFRWL